MRNCCGPRAATRSCSNCRQRDIVKSMAVVVASAEIGDDEFLAAFTSCALPLSSFRHGDHLRLAWLLLHRKPFDEALTLVREGIQKYAVHVGAPHLYHETVTT